MSKIPPVEKCVRMTVFLAVVFAALGGPAFGQKSSPNFVSNEVLVKFAPGKTQSTKKDIVGRLRSNIAEELGDLGWVRVRLPENESVGDAIRSYEKMADIEAAQPNFYYRLQAIPNDAL